MTDTDHAIEAIGRAADGLVPQLTERLARHGLGEIEVVDGDLRLRVRRAGAERATDPPAATDAPDAAPAEDAPPGDVQPAPIGVSAPAVGFFVYAEGLGPGLGVVKGDALGHVEMLGVRHDVRAPRAGTVRSLVAESGEAVEYGQVVVEIEAGETP
jgi:acetyl-CoA carboxylase biotin carboxyl carrier protein